jgi:uracil-DNA glycosylase
MWKDILSAEQQLPYFMELKAFVEHEYATKTIYPPREDLYNAFRQCPFDQVKVVLLGQDPYHNPHQAHGLCFSVRRGTEVPPSLRNIFQELNRDLGLPIPTHGDLTVWANQGVLLLNAILTVEAHHPLSHQNKGWETFTDHILTRLDADPRPKVFVLWGNYAKRKRSLLVHDHHLILIASHPSPLSARHSFFGSRPFSRINEFLSRNHLDPIDWRLPE